MERYQQWDLRYYRDNGEKYYVFVNRKSGKVLDVPELSTRDGVQLIQYEYNGGKNQDFRLKKTRGKYYRIQCRHSGKYVDVKRSSLGEGAPVIQKNKKNENFKSQEWYFDRV